MKKEIVKKNKTVFTYFVSIQTKLCCLRILLKFISYTYGIYLYVLVFFHIMFTAYIFLHI